MQHVFAGERLMKLYLILLSASATAILGAGEPSIHGRIVDPSGAGVPGAIIACGALRAESAADGEFLLTAAGRCQATVTKAGFETARLALEPGIRVELKLAAATERMIVSATRTRVTLEESGVSATLLTGDEIRTRQYAPVLDLLRDVPGLAVVNTARRGGLTGVFTRGAQRTGTLLLLDGVPLNEPGGEMNLAHLATADLDRIEIVRGPESALFGAEAAAGIVQLFTARGDAESTLPRGRFSYERGTYSTDRWTANLNGGIAQRIDYSLTAEQLHTVGMFPNDFYRNTSGTANLGARLAAGTEIRAIYRQFDAVAGNPNAVGYGLFDSDARGADRDSTLAVRLTGSRGPRFLQQASFNYHRLRNRFDDEVMDGPYNLAALVRKEALPGPRVYFIGLADPNAPVPAGLTLVKTTQWLYPFPGLTVSDRKNFDYQGTLSHPGGALVFGFEHERQAGVISLSNVARNNTGGFIHEQFRLGRLYLTGGARTEHSSTFGSRFAPRGSVTLVLAGGHGMLSSTYLRASAGRGITEPSLLQNFARESFYVGNLALRPEKIGALDVGVVQELFGRRVRAEATFFRNSFEDLIVFDFSSFPSSWKNVDRSWGRGLETSVTVRPMRHVQVAANWTRLYTKITRTDSASVYTGVGQELPRRPKNSGAAWISITPRRWTLVAGGRWTGERQDADFVFGATRNPGYGTAYVSGSYALTRHVTPYVRVDNLLNERYEEILGYTSLRRNAVTGLRVTW
jgi:outer membrane cobalamin receptor